MQIFRSFIILIIICISFCRLSSEYIKKDKDINKLSSVTSKFFEKPSSISKRYLENDSLIINFSDVYVEKCHIDEIEERFFVFTCCFKKLNYKAEGPDYIYIEDLGHKMLCYRMHAIDMENGVTATLIFLKKNDCWKLTAVIFKVIES